MMKFKLRFRHTPYGGVAISFIATKPGLTLEREYIQLWLEVEGTTLKERVIRDMEEFEQAYRIALTPSLSHQAKTFLDGVLGVG